VEPVLVRIEVLADSRHRQRIGAEQLQIVGDVRRAAAELTPQMRYEERDVQDMDLVGQDVILERILENHDVVVGYGAADQCCHPSLFPPRARLVASQARRSRVAARKLFASESAMVSAASGSADVRRRLSPANAPRTVPFTKDARPMPAIASPA